MKNIVNNSAPFFNKYGQILSFGRMAIVAPNTDDEYLDVKSSDRTPLSNPIELSIYGRPPESVYVDDGVSYDVVLYQKLTDDKYMFVDRYYVDSNSNSGSSSVSSITSVGSVDSLRYVDVSEGKVIVLGYSDAEDYCPPRIFVWTVGEYHDNAGTIVKSRQNDSGAWILNESNVVDIRFFGVNPESEDIFGEVDDPAIRRAVVYSQGKTLYFPKGNYYFAGNFSFNGCNVLMEMGCIFHPVFKSGVLITIPSLDTRGGFFAEGAIPVVSGTLNTSIYRGFTIPFLSKEGVLDNVNKIVFDYFNEDSSEREITLRDKFVIWEIDPKENVKTSNCVIFDATSGKYTIKNLSTTTSISDGEIKTSTFGGKGVTINPNKIESSVETIFNDDVIINKIIVSNSGSSVHFSGDTQIDDCSHLSVTGRATFNEIKIPYKDNTPATGRAGDICFRKNWGLYIHDGFDWIRITDASV